MDNLENQEGGYTQLMKKAFDTPFVGRLQKRKTRRSIVALFLLWLVGINIIAFSLPELIWVWGLLFLLFFPLASLTNMSVRGVTEIPISGLDDRQARLKSSAYHSAFWIGIVLAFALGLAYMNFYKDGLHVVVLIGSGVGFVFGLPAIILAWKLPDEIEDDELGEEACGAGNE